MLQLSDKLTGTHRATGSSIALVRISCTSISVRNVRRNRTGPSQRGAVIANGLGLGLGLGLRFWRTFTMADRNPQKNNTFFPHSDSEALLQAAIATLVALVLVDATAALISTRVDVLFANGTSKEPFTSVARLRPVVLPCRTVTTDGTLSPRSSNGCAAGGAMVERRPVDCVRKLMPLGRVVACRCHDCRHLGEMMWRCWITEC